MKSNGTLKIAVQKSGRLSEGSMNLLTNMGLEFEAYKGHLFARCRNMAVDILFLRDDDIPEYVQDGIADLGVVGRNILMEGSMNVRELLPLDFGYCSLCIAVPEQDASLSVQDLQGKRIATSYPKTLQKYFDQKGISAQLVVLKGCVEIAPALSIADAIGDLVSTGSTLRTNRLRVLETVLQSQAILIGSAAIDARKQALLANLLTRCRAVQDARRYKYVMFNMPKIAIEDAKKIVPGCKSPTIIPLADPDFVAVHSVIEEETFWDTVDKIRACGGSGILVTPIEKFIR